MRYTVHCNGDRRQSEITRESLDSTGTSGNQWRTTQVEGLPFDVTVSRYAANSVYFVASSRSDILNFLRKHLYYSFRGMSEGADVYVCAVDDATIRTGLFGVNFRTWWLCVGGKGPIPNSKSAKLHEIGPNEEYGFDKLATRLKTYIEENRGLGDKLKRIATKDLKELAKEDALHIIAIVLASL